ncbi:caspase family protein [uncultured Rubinisphaera sp.]|uniref:caspase family protein n=1 Tax=uncultured Rubinisphaera sp. TaxID=1678686 RepID=UPI000EE62178|nr:hypothetical protein [Planctomycetaceae bacterium]|tara:strand:- start:587 stop:1570 length:984 start_codon:yes stop_codon:yes gene_type:complete
MRNIILITLILSIISLSSVHSAERKLAVIVGVGSYRSGSGLGPLGKAPVNDAHQFAEVLRKQGYTVFEMTHDVARQEGQHLMAPHTAYIRDAIDGVLNFPNLGREDAVIVSFHGHGVQFDEVDATGRKTPRFYFCPADATIKNVQTANQLTERNHLLPLDELYESLNKCTAATKLLVVDACRNDPTRPGLNRSGLASSTLPKLPPPPGGIAAFFSCKPNEVAFQNTDEGYGYFTRFLVDGLQGKADLPLASRPADGVVTFAELSVYVANNTYAEVYALHKAKQSPELRGELDLNLPLARVTPVPRQPLPSDPPASKTVDYSRFFPIR